MLRRFIRFTNHAVIGTVVGGWLLAKLLTLTAADVGGVLGAIGAWLKAPEVVARVNLIGLVLLAFLLGLLFTVAAYIKHYPQLLRSQTAEAPKVEQMTPAATPAPAAPVDQTVPDDFKPTTRQSAAAAVLQRNFPTRCDLQDVYSAMMQEDYTLLRSGVTKAEVASDLEVLADAHIVRIEWLSNNFAYYHLTKPGRVWLNERSARQRGRRAPARPSDY